ncbi:hypothetical protein HDF08_001568 [Edaphobacter lichenicola]|uniref:Uncharacterized protein n=1 Tax=Tunturiibacter lichenicola TaxID=2051959 RepID=A0A852VE29_9BACT|nr:hypothetical protein [Edaphobacter lichenicola]
MKRFSKTIFGFLTVIAVLGGGLQCLIWWGRSTPSHPKNLPTNAVWLRPPTVVFDFTRRGNWVGCSVESQNNRCVVTDARGNVEYDDLFLPIEGIGPVRKERLIYSVRNSGCLWVYLNLGKKNVPVIHLQDGTVLLPLEGYNELKNWLEKIGSNC